MISRETGSCDLDPHTVFSFGVSKTFFFFKLLPPWLLLNGPRSSYENGFDDGKKAGVRVGGDNDDNRCFGGATTSAIAEVRLIGSVARDRPFPTGHVRRCGAFAAGRQTKASQQVLRSGWRLSWIESGPGNGQRWSRVAVALHLGSAVAVPARHI